MLPDAYQLLFQEGLDNLTLNQCCILTLAAPNQIQLISHNDRSVYFVCFINRCLFLSYKTMLNDSNIMNISASLSTH